MSPDYFPTFKRVGRVALKIVRYPPAQKVGFAVGGVLAVVAWTNILSYVIPVEDDYGLEPWYLWLWSLGGFGGALVAAWGLRRSWAGFTYGLMLGLLFGGVLFYWHGGVALMAGPDGCYDVLMGDRTAGLLFFALSVLGGCVGNRLAGVQILPCVWPLTAKRVILWVLGLCLLVAYWFGLYWWWWSEWRDYYTYR